MADAVAQQAAAASALAWGWEQPWREWVAGALDASEKAQRLAAYRAERDRLVEAGELAETRAQLLRQAASEYLTVRGWSRRRWKPIPAGEHGAGRRWGAPTQNFTGSLTLELPDAQGQVIRRVAYWTSEPGVRGLREWTDRHGRGPAHIQDLPPAVQGLAMMAMAMSMPLARHMRERDELRAKILTVGDILRTIAARAAVRTYAVPTSTPPE